MNQEQINKLAYGWALFETNDGLRIQKCDESGRFASDDHALEYIAESAESGNQLHAAALAHHYASIAGLAVDSAGVIDAAHDVVAAWESGDLAGAVRHLAATLLDL